MVRTGTAKNVCGITFPIATRKLLEDTVDLLGFGFQIQLATQVSESVIDTHATEIEVFNVIVEGHLVDGAPTIRSQ